MSKFKFSVIIPVYNVELYLEETIKSVLNQSIGFRSNIQLILINDGSSDNSKDICLKYEKSYPNNVIFIDKKNGGVSSARNAGLEKAEGELITFLDGDDLWSRNAFFNVYENYLCNKSAGIYSCKMIFFDAVKKKGHVLNNKYKKNKVVNILKDFDYPQLSASSLFIKKSLIGKHKFDVKLTKCEDGKFINELILENGKYMVLKSPIYYYRRRPTDDSAIQNQIYSKDYYTVTPVRCYKYLLEYSKKIYGETIDFIKNTVLYDLQYRIEDNKLSVLNETEKKQYLSIIIDLLNDIGADFILKSKRLNLFQIYNMLELIDADRNLDICGKRLYLNGVSCCSSIFNLLIIDQIYFKDNKMKIFGKIDTRFLDKKLLNAYNNFKKVKIDYYEFNYDNVPNLINGVKTHSYEGFNLTLDLDSYISLVFKYNDFVINPIFGIAGIFTESLPYSYKHYNGKTYIYNDSSLKSFDRKFLRSATCEIKNEISLFKCGKIKNILIRQYIKFIKLFKKKKIMLVSDRLNKADDNGEHFFKYMVSNHKEYKTYFILSKKSPDYKRLKKIGKTLDINSVKYKLLFLISDYIVSSHAENYITNLLGSNNKFVSELYDFKFVFLQHGIIKDDLSPWINVNSKKIDMFVTSSQNEYDSLLKYNYNFGKDVVKLTGASRYDGLLKNKKEINEKNQILLAPSWRASLSTKINRKTGERIYNERFKETEYFKFYNRLMNDDKILKCLKEYKYTIKFLPHPNVLVQLNDFDKNDYVEFVDSEINYQKEFCESKLMITDYSSVFFDFAFLKKPVIYAQSDREEFFKGQLYNKGYFDYDKMGFGEVCLSYDNLVDSIVRTIKNGCNIEDKYIKRINKFFTYCDDQNCNRIFEEIERL